MNDKELLELAAKAAGIKLTWFNGLPKDTTGFHPAQNIFPATSWNPLTDDGDALRLAVKLGIDLVQHSKLSEGRLECAAFGDWSVCEIVPYEGDPYAATRRAIVRAAAAIGGR